MKSLIQFFIVLIGTIAFGNQVKSQEINVNQEFSFDTAIMPFTGTSPVYSVKFTGSINLLSDSSLIRVVLIDDHRNHYLIYEAYPLITTDSAFSVNEVCDETYYLDGIVPDSIRIDIINAFLTFNTLKIETDYVANASQLQAQAKWNIDSVKIAVMNQRIQEKHMYWRAGRNIMSYMPFNIKEENFSRKFNLQGYDYYKGGIFERLSHRIFTLSISSLVSDFDWRKRHGANLDASPYFDGDPPGTERTGWLTKLQYQNYCKTCYAFSAVGAVEAYVNLYFNNNIANPNLILHPEIKHQIDVDLSETEVIRCQSPQNTLDCWSGGYNGNSLHYIQLDGVCNESCLPYSLLTGPPPYLPPYNPPPPPPCSLCDPNQQMNLLELKEVIL